MPPPAARPAPIRARAAATSRGSTALAEQLALAGYERVERVEERGQFAVRGGLVDVFPTTGREPLRIELFGDEIEGIRAFSPFTQRALREVESATIYPAAERRGDARRARRCRRRGGDAPRALRPTSCRRSTAPPDFVWQPDEVRAVWARGGRARARRSTARPSSTRCRRASRSRSTRSGRRSSRAGSPRPRTSSRGLLRQGLDVVVAFAAPRRGRAAAPAAAPGRGGDARAGRRADGALTFAVAPARRGFVWRDLGVALLPGHAGLPPPRRRARPRRPAARSRASPTCAPATTSSTRTTASPSCSASRRRRSPASPATTSCSASAARTASSSRTSRSARSRATSAPTRSAPTLSKLGGKAWDNLKTRAREHLREMAGELLQLYAAAPDAARASPTTSSRSGSSGSRPSSRTARPRTRRARSRRSRRTSRRRGRWTGSSAATSASARPRSRCAAAFTVAVAGKQVLMLVPTTILAQQHWNTFRDRYRDFPVRVEMVSRFRKPAEVKQVLAEFGEGKVDVLIGTHRVLSRDVIPKDLGLVDRRRGAALRRRAEGAAAPAAARGRRARAERDADPAHAAHVARRACATSR